MENKNNGLIYGIIIGVLSATVIFLVVYIVGIKGNKVETNNSQAQQKEQTQQQEKINYEIVENNGSYLLKVNGKITDIELLDKDLSQIMELNDILAVKRCTSYCTVFAVNKNGYTITTTDSTLNTNIFTTKGTHITNAKVVGNELFITSQNIVQDIESICDAVKNNENVIFEEKFTYNNGTFGQATTVKTVSAEEYKQQNNLNCNN